jgi:aminopeptidase N
MSAIKTSEEPSAASTAGQPGFTIYKFEQRTSIPSYLIAIVSGNLAGREIGPRSTVWCEPEMVDAAAWEFAVSFLISGQGWYVDTCHSIRCPIRIPKNSSLLARTS